MNTRGKKNERGASATEYGLAVAGIAAAIILPLQAMDFGMGAYAKNVENQECVALGNC